MLIIGNPPYVEKRTVESKYQLTGYKSEITNNLYSYCSERSFYLLISKGYFGFIVPVSSMSTSKFEPLQKFILEQGTAWLSHFDDRPSRLFDGLEHIQLTIILTNKTGGSPSLPFTTACRKWSSIERSHIFGTLFYAQLHKSYLDGSVAKAGGNIEVDILDKLWLKKKDISDWLSNRGKFQIFYTRKVHAFLNILDFVPEIYDGRGNLRDPSEQKTLTFDSKILADTVLCTLNSTLFRWFLSTFSDCRNLNRREVLSFPIELLELSQLENTRISKLATSLSNSLRETSEIRGMRFKNEVLRVQCIIPRLSKPIIDEIDRILAQHYGFPEEELDFIINYDIKYRMGRDSES
ncbi:Eco57I restriction-modification methylase domain-containing protein [Microcystis sp. LE19-55.1A]|uniref:Eco57I restriction-modification methylase domain-containing protein n=1 Tax=Microcystis sp. LE19-55.1A TaxID=3016436 RepID=UPI0022C3B9CF|nr:Eco57I restriction-modification methylase domain-containing protein [Microcystis sp. LE19-55.1A]MCZ8201654.1 Eco57I restriction-modification methylase domain-containing protein [Microcystis sp. LE19-55.1A]MCZ8308224.1 Eco57I restriction-modification methylase domain-containing protein [Microcystis sp. LE19-98.1E]